MGIRPPSCSPPPPQASQKLAESSKLEDQINLQHLVELMRVFHVSHQRQQPVLLL